MKKVLMIVGCCDVVGITRAIEKVSIDTGIDIVMVEKMQFPFDMESLKFKEIPVSEPLIQKTDKYGKPLTNPGSKFHK